MLQDRILVHKDRGLLRTSFPLKMSVPRWVSERHPETLRSSSSRELVIPVNSTVPLDESLHHPRLEVGHTSALPNHVFVEIISSVSVGTGILLNQGILRNRDPLESLDLRHPVSTGTLTRPDWTTGESDDRKGPRGRTDVDERHVGSPWRIPGNSIKDLTTCRGLDVSRGRLVWTSDCGLTDVGGG